MPYIPVVDRGSTSASRRQELGAWTVAEYLTAYGMAVVAPLLIFSGLLLHRYSSIEYAQLELQVLQTARAMKVDLDRELGTAIATLEALTTSPSLAAGDLAAFHKHASTLARLRPHQSVALIDATGRQVLDTRLPWREADLEPASQSTRLEASGGSLPYVSDLLPTGDSISITIATPADVVIARRAMMTIGISRISEVIGALEFPRGWQASVYDRNGNNLARSGEPLSAGNTSTLDPLLRSALDQGVVRLSNAAGREELAAHIRSDLAGWSIVVRMQPQRAGAPTWSWRTLAFGGGALLVLSFLLALYFGRKLANPIKLTALAASAVGRGEAIPQLKMRLREVDDVLSALKAASAQRRLAEDQLRAAHERITLALTATEMGMWERDLKTNEVIWSDAMYRIFGRTPEEFTGDPDQVLSFVHPDDRAQFRRTHEEAVRGPGDTFEHEARILRPTGEVRWLYRRAFVRRNDGGEAVSVLGVALDITERKEAENANARLAAIVASSSEAIVSLSPDGSIATWNAGAEKMFGIPAADAVGMPLQKLLTDDRRADWHRMNRTLQAGETVRLETTCRARDGRGIEVSIVANPVLSGSGKITGYSMAMRDISERKEHDRHLASVMRELTHRSKNLLAIVQAMARQTALRSESLIDFERRFSGRLQCLSRSHELLIGNDWEGALLGDLVAMQRSSFGPRQERIRASGPDVFLRPEAVLNIGLALHELAINAERHGALSVPAGRVDLNWKVEGAGDRARLSIVWREQGKASAGDLLNRGFGRDVLEHVAPTALSGKVLLKPTPEGLLWSLEVPADQFTRGQKVAAA
jgi:PAS domain S-box-containing protein